MKPTLLVICLLAGTAFAQQISKEDRAAEVKGKRYRESLQNNRDTVLLSKELVTIHCEVPIELELENMRTQAPDVSACRALFNELEFTTLLKDLAPEEEATPLSIITDPSTEEISRFVTAARTHGFSLAFDTSLLEVASEQVAETESEAIEEEEPELKTMSLGLFDGPQPAAEDPWRGRCHRPCRRHKRSASDRAGFLRHPEWRPFSRRT